MRSRWEEGGNADLDAPATITERQLRGLRRRAGFGVLALMLALVSVGGLGWTLFAGPQGLEQVQSLKEQILTRVTSRHETEDLGTNTLAPAQSQTGDSTLARPPGADSVRTTTSAAAPGDRGENRGLETQASSR